MEKINDIITIVPFRTELLEDLVKDFPPANADTSKSVVVEREKIDAFIAGKPKLSVVEHPGDSSYILVNDHPSLSVKKTLSSSGTLFNIEVNAVIEETFAESESLDGINDYRNGFCLLFMDADGKWMLSIPLPHSSGMDYNDTTSENRTIEISFHFPSLSKPKTIS